jgi:hypothetical protein
MYLISIERDMKGGDCNGRNVIVPFIGIVFDCYSISTK